ncbi:unnamed protein product [Rotaria socialis]|uniref:PDZ domain-containing protein n=1 Tax=Rotaria socialis TaxID=392032 RepID=A0A818G5G3_9BILA|nr:unnamed protein product [Rotaria socialis]CAF4511488.1 unnamed protein product [Rotaria socialis]
MNTIQKKSASSITDTKKTSLPITNNIAVASSSNLSKSVQDDIQKPSIYEEYSVLQFNDTNTDNIRHIELKEALGLDFNSFLPGNNQTQIHFISNVQPYSIPYKAGLRDGDRILTVNGLDITNNTHEDVRNMILNKSAVKLTVMYDPKYLSLIQCTKSDLNKTTSSPRSNYESKERKLSKDLNTILFLDSQGPVNIKHCIIKKESAYKMIGFLLRYTANLHMTDGVKINFPAYNSGLRSGDVILFINKKNIEQMTHNDVKVIIQTLTKSNQTIDLIVINKNDMQRYRNYKENNVIDWNSILSNNNEDDKNEEQTEPLYSCLDHRPSNIRPEISTNAFPIGSRICVLEISNTRKAGFAISNTNSPPYIVCKIENKSPAEKAGLKLNDILLSVNGKSLTETSYKDTVQLIKEALQQKTIQMVVNQQSSSEENQTKEKSKSLTSQHSDHSDVLIVDSKEINSNTINTVQQYQRQRTKELSYTLRLCHLHATNTTDGKPTITFGFEITEDPDYEYPVISHVEIKSPGERAGLQVRDVLLKVNDRKTKGLKFEKVKKAIEKGKQDGRLEILVVDKEVFDYCKRTNKKFKQPDIKIKHIFPKSRLSTSLLKLPSITATSSLTPDDRTEQITHAASTFNVHRLSIPKPAESEDKQVDKVSSNFQSKVDSDISLPNNPYDTTDTSIFHETPCISLDSVLNSVQQMNTSSVDQNLASKKQREASQSSTDQSIKEFISNTINNIFQNIGTQKSVQPDYDIPIEHPKNSKTLTSSLPTTRHDKNLSEQVRRISQSCNTICSNQSNGLYDYIRDPRRCVLKIERNKGLGFILSATNDYDHTITAVEKNSAADTAGLQINDEIIEIDGRFVRNIKYEQVVDILISAMHTRETVELSVVNSRSSDIYLPSIDTHKTTSVNNLSNNSNNKNSNNNNNNNNNILMGTTCTTTVLDKNHIISRLDSLSQQIMNRIYTNLPDQSNIFHNTINQSLFGSLPSISTGIASSPKAPLSEKTNSMASLKNSCSNILDSYKKDVPTARLCRIQEFQSSSFYGFFLCGDPKKLGRIFIADIRKNSSAALCGLRDGDQIIEVNGTNIQALTYETILNMIKIHMEHRDLELLVLDKKSFRWYQERNYPMTLQTLPTIVHIEPIINDINSEKKSSQVFDRNTDNTDSIDQQVSTTNL